MQIWLQTSVYRMRTRGKTTIHVTAWQRSRFAYKFCCSGPWYECIYRRELIRELMKSIEPWDSKLHNKSVLHWLYCTMCISAVCVIILHLYVHLCKPYSVLCRKYCLFKFYSSKVVCSFFSKPTCSFSTSKNTYIYFTRVLIFSFQSKLIDL